MTTASLRRLAVALMLTVAVFQVPVDQPAGAADPLPNRPGFRLPFDSRSAPVSGPPSTATCTQPGPRGRTTYQNATIHWTPQQGTWITR